MSARADGYETPDADPALPPAADIPGAIAATEHALLTLTDADRFERIAAVCLSPFAPSLRPSGGSGDQQRDAVAGTLRADDDELVITVSLDKRWPSKIRRDLDGLKKHGHTPVDVWSVTNQRAGSRNRNKLEKDAPKEWGHRLRIFDLRFLALRLLTPELLDAREELLGLAPPVWPITLEPADFSERLPDLGAPEQLVGRAAELSALTAALDEAHMVEMTGPGGIGKTRLALAAATASTFHRVRFLDDRTPLDSDRLHAELAGADRLLLVIDNAHRREDLGTLVNLLSGRSGDTRLLLITRPGFGERMAQAVAGSPFSSGRDSHRTVTIDLMGNAQIGELVRASHPTLELEGAIEGIISMAEGNPLIALLAHHVAVERGGLDGFSRGQVLGEYARSAVHTAVEKRSDVNADDLNDSLMMVATMGQVGDDDHALLADLLGLTKRVVRNRLADLADVGLLADSGGQSAITPDLLSAHLLREAYFAGGRAPAVSYREIWEGASKTQRDRMCTALGGLQGFAVDDSDGVGDLVGSALAEQARVTPTAALGRAQSLAPGLGEVAVAAIDEVLATSAPGPLPPAAARTAMEVLSRIGNFSLGWPRQLAVAQACYAHAYDEADDKAMREGLTQVYKRLPVKTSRFDGHVLAGVLEGLATITGAFAEEHAGEPGTDPAIAVACGQLLALVMQNTYMSIENEHELRMGAGYLPGSERTATTLRTGARLLRSVLGGLGCRAQLRAVKPLAELRRVATGTYGPFGATPSDELKQLVKDIIGEEVENYAALSALPLPTKAAIAQGLGATPWPDDAELRDFRTLFERPRERDITGVQRASEIADMLLEMDDVAAELRRWEGWLAVTARVDTQHEGRRAIGNGLFDAATKAPIVIREALQNVLVGDGPLNGVAGRALTELMARDDGQDLAEQLLSAAGPQRRAAVVNGLAGTAADWADDILERLGSDPEDSVRRSVALVAGWTENGTRRRVLTGLHACLPEDVSSAVDLLSGLKRRGFVLGDTGNAVIDELALSAASQPRVDGEELSELGGLSGRSHVVIAAGALARRAAPRTRGALFSRLDARRGRRRCVGPWHPGRRRAGARLDRGPDHDHRVA